MISKFFKSNNLSGIFRIGIISMVPIFSTIEIIANDRLSFAGNNKEVITLQAGKDTGIDDICVLYSLSGVTITYKSQSNNVRWMSYGNLGGGYAEEIHDIKIEDNSCTLNNPAGDMGYIIYDNGKTYTFWLVDYSKHAFSISNIILPDMSDCDAVELSVDCTADPIHYYTINGRQETLSRDIDLEFNTLTWSEKDGNFIQDTIIKNLPSISDRISVYPPPYCDTFFSITGDRFMHIWDMAEEKESALYVTKAVDCHTEAIPSNVNEEDTSNRIDTDVDGLGGSAPCEITFNANVTDAVIHNEWQMANDEEFEDITYRINEQNFTYTFTSEGVTYVRYVGSNSDGSCETHGDVYTVSIGASDLLVPNAFSPNDDGVNDEWKVSYRSLIDFECWIFDKQGHLLYHFTDPSGGWDGRHNGKTVKTGVYYYVINAVGSDGKKYKKSGDINIIGFKGNRNSSGMQE